MTDSMPKIRILSSRPGSGLYCRSNPRGSIAFVVSTEAGPFVPSDVSSDRPSSSAPYCCIFGIYTLCSRLDAVPEIHHLVPNDKTHASDEVEAYMHALEKFLLNQTLSPHHKPVGKSDFLSSATTYATFRSQSSHDSHFYWLLPFIEASFKHTSISCHYSSSHWLLADGHGREHRVLSPGSTGLLTHFSLPLLALLHPCRTVIRLLARPRRTMVILHVPAIGARLPHLTLP